ncbi:MAG: hypothetical protein IJ410_00865 [Oscillospiraceae bacterium]|nr:hypothetical protein [Oscillospiraceae bacterium]
MDKEKMLKKYTIKMIAGHIFTGSVLFVWMYAFVYDIIDRSMWVKSGIVMIVVSIIFGWLDNKINGEKDKAELHSIMPLIISIHDTPESLEKEKKILSAIDLGSFVIGFSFREFSFIFIVIMALGPLFRTLAGITNEKIKYLENKPEGL